MKSNKIKILCPCCQTISIFKYKKRVLCKVCGNELFCSRSKFNGGQND